MRRKPSETAFSDEFDKYDIISPIGWRSMDVLEGDECRPPGIPLILD
jgi:hypothetical protein